MEISRETIKIAGLLPKLRWINNPRDPIGWKLADDGKHRRKRGRRWHFKKREQLFVRDGGFVIDGNNWAMCSYCYTIQRLDELTIDHIQPVSHGGRHLLINLTLACYRCNRDKDDMTLLDYLTARRQGW